MNGKDNSNSAPKLPGIKPSLTPEERKATIRKRWFWIVLIIDFILAVLLAYEIVDLFIK